MRSAQRKFFVVTGGPGAGKTTLLGSIAATGVAIMPEAGRAIIRAQRAIDGPALPDRDPALFAELMLSWDIRSYEAADPGSVVFFDRGVPDCIGYLRLMNVAVPQHMYKAAELFRYHRIVFVLPPWPEIYAADAERKQTLEEAERTFEAVRDAYRDLDYRPLEVPRLSVEDRRDFVLKAALG